MRGEAGPCCHANEEGRPNHTISASHTQFAWRCFAHAVPHAKGQVTRNGKLNLQPLHPCNATFHRAVPEGLVWDGRLGISFAAGGHQPVCQHLASARGVRAPVHKEDPRAGCWDIVGQSEQGEQPSYASLKQALSTMPACSAATPRMFRFCCICHSSGTTWPWV